MTITSKEALELLKEAETLNPGRWIEHSKKVGEAASRIANKMGLDEEKARTLGYIHDIGKRFGKGRAHVIRGYRFIKEMGIEEEYANICLTHSYLNNDINCTAGGIPDPQGEGYDYRKQFIEKHEYTLYEKIINLCDLMCTNEFMTLEQRLIELMLRRGTHSNTDYHIKEAMKLKNEINEKISCSVYSLFPEITLDIFWDLEKIQL